MRDGSQQGAVVPGRTERRFGRWRGTRRPCQPAPGPAACAGARRLAGNPDALQHGLELGAVPALARGDQKRQRFLALLAGQVHLRGQAAAGTAQAMIGRLGGYPAGRLGLQIPLLQAPAVCWCARATVESTDRSQVISPAASARPCKAVRIFRRVPSRCQRRNSPCGRWC
jgi:hypothetical protein